MDLLELQRERERDRAGGTRHPWERARLAFFSRVLERSGVLQRSRTVLDAGAGDCWFASQLAIGAPHLEPVACWDSGFTGDHRRILAARRDRVTLCTEPPDARFDLVLALDVLEHIDDDRDFLARIAATHLKPESALLISVPAWGCLFSRHDAWLGHRRRYSPTMLRRVVGSAGLRVVAEGGLFPSLLLPRAARTVVERLGGGGGDEGGGLAWSWGPFVTGCVDAWLALDNRLALAASAAGLSLPGLSAWALCER